MILFIIIAPLSHETWHSSLYGKSRLKIATFTFYEVCDNDLGPRFKFRINYINHSYGYVKITDLVLDFNFKLFNPLKKKLKRFSSL